MTPVSPQEHAQAAAELIAFALRRVRPGREGDYQQLLDRYSTDLSFRELTQCISKGLGLDVLAVTRGGLVLSPTVDSVFASKLIDMRNTGMDADDRLVAGLALLGIAAYAYPNSVDFDDPDARTVDIAGIDAFIRAAAHSLPAPTPESTESIVSARRAADVYLDWPDYVPTAAGGRYKRGCTYRALEEVLSGLERQGMARPQPALGPNTHQLTDRFRVLVADEASNTAYEALAAVRRSLPTETTS